MLQNISEHNYHFLDAQRIVEGFKGQVGLLMTQKCQFLKILWQKKTF